MSVRIQATDKVRTNGQNHQAEQRERGMARASSVFYVSERHKPVCIMTPLYKVIIHHIIFAGCQ